MPDRRAIEAALRHLVPRIPKHEFEAVADHALDSDGLRSAEAGTAAWLSLTAYVRHTFTDYDKLLAEGLRPRERPALRGRRYGGKACRMGLAPAVRRERRVACMADARWRARSCHTPSLE